MSDEAALFTAAMRRSRLCLRCIGQRSTIAEHRLVGVIRSVQRSVTVIENVEDCDSCQRRTLVYRLT